MRKTDLLSLGIIILVTILLISPIFINLEKDHTSSDWLQITSMFYSAKNTVIKYKQIPAWSPYLGGGYPLISNPQDISLSPLFSLILLFGDIIGLKLILILLLLSGGIGMYFLTKDILRYNNLGAILSSLTFSLLSIFSFSIHNGNRTEQFYYLLLPFLTYFFIRSIKEKKYIIPNIFILSLMVFNGNLKFMLALFYFGLLAIAYSVVWKDKNIKIDKKPIKNFIIICTLTFLVCLVKIAPVFELMSNSQGCIGSYDSYEGNNCHYKPNGINDKNNYLTYGSIKDDLWGVSNNKEESMSTSPINLFLFLLSLIFFRKKILRFMIIFLFFFAIALGPNLYGLMRLVPFYEFLDSPVQHTLPIIMFLFSVIIGNSCSEMIRITSKKKYLQYIVGILIVGGIIFQFTGSFAYGADFSIKNDMEETDSFYHTRFIKIPDTYYEARANSFVTTIQKENLIKGIGTIYWTTAIVLEENAIPKYFISPNKTLPNKGYRGEIYLEKDENSAIIKRFTPNRIEIETKLKSQDTITINQNYDRYWKASCGKAYNKDGLIGIDAKDCKEIILEYKPIIFYITLMISNIVLMALILVMIYEKK